MKKLTFLMLALIAMGGILASCNKDKNKENSEPTATEYTVAYVVKGAADFGYSPCFKYDLKYTDANGEVQTKNGVAGPWNITFTVKAPYTGKIEGNIVYNENELPEENIILMNAVGTGYAKGQNVGVGSIVLSLETTANQFKTKEKFLNFANNNPEHFTFSKTVEIK